jgi:alkylhydroperoxidase/carboxymuconolactone decarboxylase family protein YurZ
MEQILDPKTQLLVALAAATAAKCQNCFAKLYGLAPNAGISDSEIRAVVAIAAKVSAKSQEFMVAFVEQASGGVVKSSAAETAGGGCGCVS